MKKSKKLRKKLPTIPVIVGTWTNIDFGVCMRCSVERRLYSPDMMLKLKVCSPCSQVCALSSLPTEDEDEEEDTDNIWLRTVLDGPEEECK